MPVVQFDSLPCSLLFSDFLQLFHDEYKIYPYRLRHNTTTASIYGTCNTLPRIFFAANSYSYFFDNYFLYLIISFYIVCNEYPSSPPPRLKLHRYPISHLSLFVGNIVALLFGELTQSISRDFASLVSEITRIRAIITRQFPWGLKTLLTFLVEMRTRPRCSILKASALRLIYYFVQMMV